MLRHNLGGRLSGAFSQGEGMVNTGQVTQPQEVTHPCSAGDSGGKGWLHVATERLPSGTVHGVVSPPQAPDHEHHS